MLEVRSQYWKWSGKKLAGRRSQRGNRGPRHLSGKILLEKFLSQHLISKYMLCCYLEFRNKSHLQPSKTRLEAYM